MKVREDSDGMLIAPLLLLGCLATVGRWCLGARIRAVTVSAQIGTAATLLCPPIATRGPYEARWWKNGRPARRIASYGSVAGLRVGDESRGGVNVSGDGAGLTLLSVNVEDEGCYVCTLIAGEDRRSRVTCLGVESRPLVRMESAASWTVEELICRANARPPPVVAWTGVGTRDGIKTFSQTFKNGTTTVVGRLILADVRTMMAADVACVVSWRGIATLYVTPRDTGRWSLFPLFLLPLLLLGMWASYGLGRVVGRWMVALGDGEVARVGQVRYYVRKETTV